MGVARLPIEIRFAWVLFVHDGFRIDNGKDDAQVNVDRQGQDGGSSTHGHRIDVLDEHAGERELVSLRARFQVIVE